MNSKEYIRSKTVAGLIVSLLFLVCSLLTPALSQGDENVQSSDPAEKSWAPPRFSEYHRKRSLMVQSQMVHRSPGVRDRAVLEAMRQVPRHLFVPWALKRAAHADRPLPIGHGQTISQPYIVALMTEALEMKPGAKVLEIGTGSGYQAAVLSEQTPSVFTMEIIGALGNNARERLQKLGYSTVKVRVGDGYFGWPEEAPFDGIIVTAGAPYVPQALKEQLADGGRLVIPVGGEELQLLEVVMNEGGKFHTRHSTACRFVKLVGEQGWRGDNA